jgi:hypothetical protein
MLARLHLPEYKLAEQLAWQVEQFVRVMPGAAHQWDAAGATALAEAPPGAGPAGLDLTGGRIAKHCLAAGAIADHLRLAARQALNTCGHRLRVPTVLEIVSHWDGWPDTVCRSFCRETTKESVAASSRHREGCHMLKESSTCSSEGHISRWRRTSGIAPSLPMMEPVPDPGKCARVRPVAATGVVHGVIERRTLLSPHAGDAMDCPVIPESRMGARDHWSEIAPPIIPEDGPFFVLEIS